MNPDGPRNERELLEAKLTALLLGELPSAETEALRKQIAADAGLAQLHERLKLTIGLVREGVCEPIADQPAAPKLSAERRQKLLAQFKTVRPEQFVQSQHRTINWLVPVGIAAALLLFAILSAPNFVKSRSTSAENAVINNLRNLDSAKQQWAADNKKSPNDQPTIQDLTPYLGRSPQSVRGETYVPGKVSEPVKVEMDAKTAPKRMPGFVLTRTYDGPNGPRTEYMFRQNQSAAGYFVASKPAEAPALAPMQAPAVEPPATLPAGEKGRVAIALPSAGKEIAANDDANGRRLEVRHFTGGEVLKGNLDGVSGLNYGIAQKGSAANRVAGTEERLRSLYDSAGVSLDKSRGETVTVNDETGDITVLANPKKVETIGAIETLNTPQPNVNGQARFVETNQSENKGLGFDWYQGNQISTTSGRVFRSINPDAGGAAASATHGGHVAGVIAGEIPQGNVVSPSEPVQATNLYFDSGVAVGGTGFGGAMRHGQGMPIFGDVPRVGRAFAAAPPVAGLPPSASDTSKFYSMNLGKNFEGTAKSGGGGIGGGGGGGDSFARDIPRVSASKSAQVANSGSIRTKAEVDALIKVKESELAALGPSPLADADPMSTSPTPTITPEVAAQLTSHLDKMRESARQQEIEFKKLKSQGAGTTSEEILIAKKSRLDQTTAQIGALESRLDQAKIYVLKESNYAKTKQELAQLRQLRERFGADQSDIAPAKPAQPAPIPQPEILTRENAFSTFSLNVSDVSFKLAATSLERGVLPDAASIRSEEFINAFDYRDPEPTAGAPIAFNSERARYPFAHNRDLLRFSVKTAAAGRQPGRPLNLVLLLDNSGSMERADRVRIIREALRVLAKQLQPQDRFSVVTFSRTAQLRVDGLTGDHAGEVIESLSNLTPEGGTNLEEAMNLAYATALKHYLANGVNRVVLLTDGAANLGNVQPETLKQKVEANRKQGIAFDCFGIGWEGYNDDLLEVLSRNGDGRYGFLNTPEEASSQFAAQLAGALKVAASDVKVQVEFNPKRVTSYRQIGYAKHQLTKEQFRDNTVDAAEIGASESGNALYTVEVNPAGSGPLCTVRVRFKVPGTSDYREHSWDVPYTGSAVALEQASPAMRLAASASAFSEWLAASPFAGEFSPDELLRHLNGVPEVYGADARPKKLEWMIRQAKSIGGK